MSVALFSRYAATTPTGTTSKFPMSSINYQNSEQDLLFLEEVKKIKKKSFSFKIYGSYPLVEGLLYCKSRGVIAVQLSRLAF
jgi:hypothetical protein